MNKHITLTAMELLQAYGIEKAKAELKNDSIYLVTERIDSMQNRQHLIAGRQSDDLDLKYMAGIREEVREHLISLQETGRLRGELPDGLPMVNEYHNLFSWLHDLRLAIQTRCPDSDMFRNVDRIPYFDYPKWHQHLASINQDIPALLSSLASSSSRSDFGRDQHLAPTYYKGYQNIGEAAYAVLYPNTAVQGADIEALNSCTQELKSVYPAHQHRDAALDILGRVLLSKEAVHKLLASGWGNSLVDMLNVHSALRSYSGHSLAQAVISLNFERLYAGLNQSEQEARQGAEKLKQAKSQAVAFNARKAAARRLQALLSKLADDSITELELSELELLNK